MMKLKLLLLLLFPILCYAQDTNLEFNKKYYECEDKWVMFPKSDSDTTYMFGFIYLDEEAGFTFNLESQLKILETGQYYGYPKDTGSNIKIRLSPKTSLVEVIPNDKLKDLNLDTVPDWLKYYKESSDTLVTLIRKGFHYNHVGGCNTALIYLEQAYKIDKHAEGLEFELAYAYNASKQYSKAVKVLDAAIEHNANNYFFYRELGYALIRLKKIELAEQIYLKGIELSDNKAQKSEMCINMTQAYFQEKNKEKFKEWAKMTKKYAGKNSEYLNYIKYWEKELKK